MSSTGFKIYTDAGIMEAQARHGETAAAVIGSVGGDGWTVKFDGRIVWREGREDFSAGDSMDGATDVIYRRVSEHRNQRLARLGIQF